jgi:hypothetical protein
MFLPSQGASPLSARLDKLALFLLGFLPVITVLSTRSAPVVLLLFTLAAGGARIADGEVAALGRALKDMILRPAALLLTAGLILIWASVLWTPEPGFSAGYAAQVVGNAILITLACLVAPRVHLPTAWRVIAAGLAVASVMIVIELLTGGGILALLGQPPVGAYRLNRVIVTVVVMTPIMAAFASRTGHLRLTSVLAVVVFATAVVSSSGAAVMGWAAGALALVLALAAPYAMVWVAGMGAVCLCLAMPFLAPEVNNLIPSHLHELMAGASSQIRGEIWRIYAQIGQENPLFGFGLEASRFIVNTSHSEGLSADAITLLSYGHPHNAPLQVWFELGFVGALILAGLLVIVTRRMDRLPTALKPYAVATFSVLFSVACISHGAWQAWWISVIGAVFVWWHIFVRSTSVSPARN